MAPVLLIVAGLAVLLLMGGKKAQASGTSTGVVPNGKGGVVPVTPSSAQGMSRDDVITAVRKALAYETDPSKLREFADSLRPDYSTYADQLDAKASQLDAGNAPPPNLAPANYNPAPAPLPPAPTAPQVPETPANPAPDPAIVPNAPATPAAFPAAGSTAYVVTHDTGPSGNLMIRDQPSTSGVVLSQVGHGTTVTIDGDATADNWYPVTTPSGVEGWAYGLYLGPDAPQDAPLGATAGQELVSQDGQPLASGATG